MNRVLRNYPLCCALAVTVIPACDEEPPGQETAGESGDTGDACAGECEDAAADVPNPPASVDVADAAEDPAHGLDEESICGPTIDWQDVEQYDGTLGPPQSLVSAAQGPVGYIVGRCTGTLVAYNLLLTAGHCFADAQDAVGLEVWFNYQEGPGGQAPQPDKYKILSLVERKQDAALDYALVRLSGAPGLRWGVSAIGAYTPQVGEQVTLVQHPGGIPKVIEAGKVASIAGTEITYNDLDTQGGSSGSGILDKWGHVVGVHEHGGCQGNTGANGGTKMQSIVASGTILGGKDELWLGVADGSFITTSGKEVGGTYVTLGCDFDGDGKGDMFHYGRGSYSDSVDYGKGDGSFTGKAESVSGTDYQPVAGDFDHDGRCDVFWYRPGPGTDGIWYGRANRTFDKSGAPLVPLDKRATPTVGDFDGDGNADVLWYSPDYADDAIWWGKSDRTFTESPVAIVGKGFRPVVADLDGDGNSDIVWYAPGSGADVIWWSNGAVRTFTAEATSISGIYEPFVGDFNGDGAQEIFWYGPGPNTDRLWATDGNGSYHNKSVTVSAVFKPVVGRFNGDLKDDIYMLRPGS